MSVKKLTNKAASIRQKLLNYAKSNRQNFQRTIDNYAIECILDRIARSSYADLFLLKGSLLFAVWKGIGKRPTRDIDLLGRGTNEIDSCVCIFKEIASIDIKDDGIIFYSDQIEGLRIKEDDEYEGIRILIGGSLSGAIFKVQIDIGFGDTVTPSPTFAPFPRMLDMQPFFLLMYPPETVFAEKLDAIISRGILNSRMKDYYDLNILISEKIAKIELMRQAVIKTFEKRKTVLPISCPIGLSEEFAQNSTKIMQWKGFLKKNELNAEKLPDVIALIRQYVATAFNVEW